MTPAERAAIISLATRLSACCTDEQARLAFSDAAIEGVPFDALIDAMEAWVAGHAADVQVIS